MKSILVKSCNSDRYYEFYPDSFRFKKTAYGGNYKGKIFVIQNRRFVLKADGTDLVLQSAQFRIDVSKSSFRYHESKMFSYLIIGNGSEFILRKRKSIWELLRLSTYDALEKIEDNDLFYLFDLIARYKKLATDADRKSFLENF